jgi:protein SCO1/2/putative membrane protein
MPDFDYRSLPAVNAGLNALAGVLLVLGYALIKRGREQAHKRVMLSAFGTSVVFLVCYLAYHSLLQSNEGVAGRKFAGPDSVRPIYYAILISHVILAAAVPVLAIMVIRYGYRDDRPRHRRWAKITFPIWMYVSITGVVIYVLLYHVYPPQVAPLTMNGRPSITNPEP